MPKNKHKKQKKLPLSLVVKKVKKMENLVVQKRTRKILNLAVIKKVKMKKRKGITLVSLITYVVAFSIIVRGYNSNNINSYI